MVAQSTKGTLAVAFYFSDGTQATGAGNAQSVQLPAKNAFEPAADVWPSAWDFIDHPPAANSQAGYQELKAIDGLRTSIGWRPNWKSEARFGVPVPYGYSNDNICIVGAPFPTKNGQVWDVCQAIPYNLATHTWITPNTNPKAGLSFTAPDEGLYQALNYYIRGDLSDATTNFQKVAGTWDGTGFNDGSGDYRGETLGLFLYTQKVLDVQPNFSNGGSLQKVESTIWAIQNSDGGIARSYVTTTNHLGSDKETATTALLYLDPSLIAYVQGIAASHQYNLSSPPPANFAINPFG